jgi:hypothetical protein
VKTWKFAYPYGGDIYMFLSCYQCSKEHLQEIMDQSKVLQTTAVMTAKLSKSTEPATKPHLYKEVIAICGIDGGRFCHIARRAGLSLIFRKGMDVEIQSCGLVDIKESVLSDT